jgi:hypothetical protein
LQIGFLFYIYIHITDAIKTKATKNKRKLSAHMSWLSVAKIILTILTLGAILYSFSYAVGLKIVEGDHVHIERERPLRYKVSSMPFSNIPDANNRGMSLLKRDSQGFTKLKTLSAGSNMLMNSSEDGTIVFSASALAQGNSPIQLELVVGGPNPTCASLSDAIVKAQSKQSSLSPVVIFLHPGEYTGPLTIPSFEHGFHLRGLVPHGVLIIGQVTILVSSLVSLSNLEIRGQVEIRDATPLVDRGEISLRAVSIFSTQGAAVTISATSPTSGGIVRFRESVIESVGTSPTDDMCILLAQQNNYQLELTRCEIHSNRYWGNFCIKNEAQAMVQASFCSIIGNIPTANFESDSSNISLVLTRIQEDIYLKNFVFVAEYDSGYQNANTDPSMALKMMPRSIGSRFFVYNDSNYEVDLVSNATNFYVNGSDSDQGKYTVPPHCYMEFITILKGVYKNLVPCNTQTLPTIE